VQWSNVCGLPKRSTYNPNSKYRALVIEKQTYLATFITVVAVAAAADDDQ